MKRAELFYIHALARMTYEASAKGAHPISKSDFMIFFSQLMQDPTLTTKDRLDYFDRCFSFEIGRRHTKRHTPQH